MPTAKEENYVKRFLDSFENPDRRKFYENYIKELDTVIGKGGEKIEKPGRAQELIAKFNAMPWQAIQAGFGRTPYDFIAKCDIENVVSGKNTKNYYDDKYISTEGKIISYDDLKEIRKTEPGYRPLGVIKSGYSYVFDTNADKTLNIKAFPAPPKAFSPRETVYCMGAPLSQEIKDNLFRYGVGCGLHNVVDKDTGEVKNYVVVLDPKTNEVNPFSTKYCAAMFKDKDDPNKAAEVSILNHSITDAEKAILLSGRPAKVTCSTEKNPEFETRVVLTPGTKFKVSLLVEREEYKEYMEYKKNREAAKAEAQTETKAETKSQDVSFDEVPNSSRKMD